MFNRVKGNHGGKLIAPLKKVVVTAAVAAPVAGLTLVVKKAVESAVKKAPAMVAGAGSTEGVAELAKNTLGGDEDGGGLTGLAKGALGAVFGGDESSSGDAPEGTGSGRRLPVQQAVDVGAPIEIVYNQFTQFEEYPKFMHRVVSVSQSDDGHVTFRTKLWKVNRQWEAEIIDQRPDERIAWRSASGVNLSGVATFHELAPRLTRIEVNVDFDPEGFLEKVGRGMRFAKRAIRADLHRFKAYVEMEELEDGGWRGFVVEGEAVEEEEYFGEAMDEDAGAHEGEPAAEEELEEEPLPEEEFEGEEELEEELAEEELEEEPLAEEELDQEELEYAAEDEPVAEEAEEPEAFEEAEDDIVEEESPEEQAAEAPAESTKRSRSKASSDRASAAKGSRSSGQSKRTPAKKGSSGTTSRSRAKARRS